MLKKLVRTFSRSNSGSCDEMEQEDRSEWGPVLITIGPQCCGKSTFIKSLKEKCTEITLDDVPGIIEKIPTYIATNLWSGEARFPELSKADVDLISKKIYGQTIKDRLGAMKNGERMLLTLLFSEEITFTFFEQQIVKVAEINAEHLNLFMEIVTDLYNDNIRLTTSTISILILEAVNDVKKKLTANIERQMKENKELICWGNTNMNPDFYKEILESAANNSRVVRFVRWGQELHTVSLAELIKRNIKRFLRTGRYAAVTKVAQFYDHSKLFGLRGKFITHVDLARAAGYEMDVMGRVVPIHADINTAKKPVKRLMSGSSSELSYTRPLTGKKVVTRWSPWTNDGRVFPLNSDTVHSLNSHTLQKHASSPNGQALNRYRSHTPSFDGGSFKGSSVNGSVQGDSFKYTGSFKGSGSIRGGSVRGGGSLCGGSDYGSVRGGGSVNGRESPWRDGNASIASEGDLFRGLGRKPKVYVKETEPTDLDRPESGCGVASDGDDSRDSASEQTTSTPQAPEVTDPFACVFNCTGLEWLTAFNTPKPTPTATANATARTKATGTKPTASTGGLSIATDTLPSKSKELNKPVTASRAVSGTTLPPKPTTSSPFSSPIPRHKN